jgi:hypothetical protein
VVAGGSCVSAVGGDVAALGYENGGGEVPRPRQPSSGAGPGKRQAGSDGAGRDLQRQAWHWALAHPGK